MPFQFDYVSSICYTLDVIKKNGIYELNILDINDDGDGVGKIDGQVVFIPNTLPNETVSCRIIAIKKGFAIGKVEKFINISQDRREPFCPYFNKCGGCSLQHMKYESQLEHKTDIVKRAFKRNAHIDITPNRCMSTDEQRYRNKIALPCSDTGIGLYRKGSHNIVPITDCPVTKDFASRLINIINQYVSTNHIPLYNEEYHTGIIKHIVARYLDNTLLVTLVVTQDRLVGLAELYTSLQEEFGNVGLNLNINTLGNNVILSDKWQHVAGVNNISCETNGIKYSISNASFYQINDDIRDKIYNDVLSNITSDDNVIDAYSGAGLLTAMMAKVAKESYGIEIIPQAVDNAEELKKLNNLKNMHNFCGDCAVELPKIITQHNISKVVLDPPRKGCDKAVLDAIVQSRPNTIIYVSCNPQTLARDCKILLDGGYTITYMQPYDMFPNTSHVETVVRLAIK